MCFWRLNTNETDGLIVTDRVWGRGQRDFVSVLGFRVKSQGSKVQDEGLGFRGVGL